MSQFSNEDRVKSVLSLFYEWRLLPESFLYDEDDEPREGYVNDIFSTYVHAGCSSIAPMWMADLEDDCELMAIRYLVYEGLSRCLSEARSPDADLAKMAEGVVKYISRRVDLLRPN